ncbi:uncharacterized protein LOC127716021 [Mytilus californianus]|uniref:uncharacterized protein LOC127716021 n=1 Tax=Mytilus californianus TaxID=6549 RepID=UPI002246C327|nr:uncharacterized protein LOC127716021 [Mytilus californianus]
MMAMMGMMIPSTTTSVSQVTLTPTMQALSTTQTSSTTNTPCIQTNCPNGYVLLTDQNASPNCYLYSGNTEKSWYNAWRTCAMTPGAFLWNPNSEAEANSVQTKLMLENEKCCGLVAKKTLMESLYLKLAILDLYWIRYHLE